MCEKLWDMFKTINERTTDIKVSKIKKNNQRIWKYDTMTIDETFADFYDELNNIVNTLFNLGEIDWL